MPQQRFDKDVEVKKDASKYAMLDHMATAVLHNQVVGRWGKKKKIDFLYRWNSLSQSERHCCILGKAAILKETFSKFIVWATTKQLQQGYSGTNHGLFEKQCRKGTVGLGFYFVTDSAKLNFFFFPDSMLVQRLGRAPSFRMSFLLLIEWSLTSLSQLFTGNIVATS